MTENFPMPAETCQNAETPICNELHNPLSISNDSQIVDHQRGTQNLVSVRTCRFESDHRYQLEIEGLATPQGVALTPLPRHA